MKVGTAAEPTKPSRDHLEITPYLPSNGEHNDEFQQSIASRFFGSAITNDGYYANVEGIDEEFKRSNFLVMRRSPEEALVEVLSDRGPLPDFERSPLSTLGVPISLPMIGRAAADRRSRRVRVEGS